MSGVLVVFAKAPRVGEVKTRMTPPLAPAEAAALYTCMLDDVLEASAALAGEHGLEPVLAAHPAEACAELARRAPRAFRVVAQRGLDLGARMEWAVAEAAAGGASLVVLRGSDSPTLAAPVLRAALEALTDVDLALSPDRDGGYQLVALRRPAPGLFAHPMGTPSVLEDTLARARSLGLRARLVVPGFDLDTVDDLRWPAEARRRGLALGCRRTLALLDDADLWRHCPGIEGRALGSVARSAGIP